MLIGLLMILVMVSLMWFRSPKSRYLPLGRFNGAKTIRVNGDDFYLEEVCFTNYQQAIHGYFQLSYHLYDAERVQEEYYDFFDFYSVALGFEDCSMRLLRIVNRVRLIKSNRYIPLTEFEECIQSFAYLDLKAL